MEKIRAVTSSHGEKNRGLQQKIRQLDHDMMRYEIVTSGNGQDFMASIFSRFGLSLLLMTLAVAVGFFAMAVYLPMWNMTEIQMNQ